MAAVQRDGLALECASEELRQDKEVRLLEKCNDIFFCFCVIWGECSRGGTLRLNMHYRAFIGHV